MTLDPNNIPVDFSKFQQDEPLPLPSDPIFLTIEELAAYDGRVEGKPIYLGLMGNIYDVTSGKSFYGPGGAYEMFSGKDATRGLASFSLSSKKKKNDREENYKDDYSDLSEKHLENAKRWQKIFESKYPIVGYIKRAPGLARDPPHQPSPSPPQPSIVIKNVNKVETYSMKKSIKDRKSSNVSRQDIETVKISKIKDKHSSSLCHLF